MVGVELEQVYPAGKLAAARNNRHERVRIGNRGYDLTLDLPKSLSVLYGLAEGELAAGIEDVYTAAVHETVAAVEDWVAYGLRGHHGDGRQAERIETSGLAGWIMWHAVARPVDGQAPDPHWHAHVVLANMARGVDGKWSAIGAGGTDLHRHTHAADALLKARIRYELTRTYGIAWERNSETGAWEIVAIPAELRQDFSKRDGQIKQVFAELGLDYEAASTAERKYRSASSKEGKQRGADAVDLREDWRSQALEQGHDPDQICVAAERGAREPAERPSIEQIAAQVWDPEHGLTAHRKTVNRADALAAVLEALPGGVAGVAEAEQLTDAVLALEEHVAQLPSGPPHLTNAARFTSRDILRAEETNLAAARDGYGRDLAVVDPRVADLAAAAFYAARGFTLSEEQAEVLERLVSAGHGVDAVVGVAGAGKTTLMAAARTAWQAAGYTIVGAATAAVAAQNLQAESGIRSATIASWIQAITGPGRDDGTRGLDGVDVLVIDEAGMVDDRELALLLPHAQQAGTMVVLIGDPKQLKAVGVGGSFAAIHRQVDGPTLTENRRQADPIERRALQLWRADRREQALHAWAAGGRVHAGGDRDDTLSALLADWAHLRTGRYSDAHAELAGMLLLAGTNHDAEAINITARALRRANGELTGPDATCRTPTGLLRFAAGDHVRVRRNDYRTRRKNPPPGTVDVLNGYRGVITAIDADRNVLVGWRRQAADGPITEQAWITPPEIAAGALSHGTAMTVAAAQGLTAGITLVYGQGLDPHTLYPAMSRDREQAHLYLPRNLLEDDVDRARHGDPDTPGQELARAIAAYARTLEGDRADRLVLTELGREPAPIAERIPHWTKRLHGHRTTAQLANLRERYQAGIRQAAARERRIAVLRTEASAGNGPAAAQVRDRLQTVTTVAGIEGQITAACAQLDCAHDSVDAARRRFDELQDQSRRGRIALRMDGTSRRQVDQDLHAAEGEFRVARTAQTDARQRLAELVGQARAAYEQHEPGSPSPVRKWSDGAGTAERHDLTTHWDTRMAAAITRDVATAHRRATTAVDVALPDLTTADKAQDAITAIDEELALRDRLTPVQDRIEQRARRAQQGAQAERNTQHRGSDPYQAHQPGHSIRPDRGPGLSR